VVPMLMVRRCFSAVVCVLFRARLGMSGGQMKRGMGITARKGERQQDDQATQEQGSLHGMGTQLRGFEFFSKSRIAHGRLKVKSGPVSASAGGPGGIGSQRWQVPGREQSAIAAKVLGRCQGKEQPASTRYRTRSGGFGHSAIH